MHSNYQTSAMLQGSNGASQQANINQQQLLLQQQLQQQGQLRQMGSSGPQQKQRVFSGTVTKMHDNFGFVDEDVFFQLSSCDGKMPTVGDRVLVEAQFNPNMPFKWNASRVQVLGQQAAIPNQVAQIQQAFNFQGNRTQQQQQQQIYSPQMQNQHLPHPQGLKFTSGGHGGAGLLGPAPVNVMNMPQQRQQQMSGGKGNRKRNAPRSGPRDRRSSPPHAPARVRSRSGERAPRKRRSRTPPPRKRSPSPSRRRSVSSEQVSRRPAPRYLVQFARYPLDRKSSDVLGVHSICPNMYIPSDFFKINYRWQDSLTLQQPLMTEKCEFHVMHKEVERLEILEKGILDPPDADHSWTARVMLLQSPSNNEFYKQCCASAEDSTDSFVHPSRLYQFLLGYKSKKEPVAIGGLWSPSLDGPDPSTNPLTLIKTAIRTCKAIAGIDLSKCTQWHRMLEVRYHRAAETRKGREVLDRVETTVIFLPDVYACMPTASQCEAVRASYLEKFEALAEAEKSSAAEVGCKTQEPKDVTEAESRPDDTAAAQKEEEPMDESKAETTPKKQEESPVDKSTEEVDAVGEITAVATHHSELDVKTLKVDMLRKELEARGLSAKGLKAALVTRLKTALEREAEDELLKDDSEDVQKMEADEEESKTKEDEQAEMEDGEVAKITDSEREDAPPGNENGKETERNLDSGNMDPEAKEDEAPMEEEKPEVDEKAEAEKAAKKKAEMQRLKRHYTLPDHPVIPVQPNPTYRKGKFECATAPLSSLLNYRPDDNKESIFEVSLFAEAFNNMLQRRFAFNIYRALVNPVPELKVKAEEEEVGKEKKSQNEQNEEKSSKTEEEDEPRAKKSKSESDEIEDKAAQKGEIAKKPEVHINAGETKSSKTRSLSGESKDSKKHEKHGNEKDSKSKHQKGRHSTAKTQGEKTTTLRRELLLSFLYFDQNHCGYIRDTDLNDIIHSIGLGLSRSQISKLTSKFLERDSLHYRKLTDVPVSQVDAYKELLEETGKVDVETLVLANQALLSSLNGKVEKEFSEMQSTEDGVVMFKGMAVNVGSLQEKLRSSECIRAELEDTLEKVKLKLGSTEKHLTRTQKDHTELETNFDTTKKRLTEALANHKAASESKSKYERALKAIKSSAENVLPKPEKTDA